MIESISILMKQYKLLYEEIKKFPVPSYWGSSEEHDRLHTEFNEITKQLADMGAPGFTWETLEGQEQPIVRIDCI